MECTRFSKASFYGFLCYAFFLLGCMPGPIATFKNDVSSDVSLWGGYTKDAVYVVLDDVFIQQYDYYPLIEDACIAAPPREATRGDGGLLYSAPENIQKYRELPNNWPEILGLLTKGSKIRAYKVVKYNAVGYGSSLYLYGLIIDGPFKNKIIELSDLSYSSKKVANGLRTKTPKSKFLRLVN